MKTYMFPGQGAQSKGMGGELFDEFGDLTKQADKILGYSIKELCLEDPRRELNKTQFTQPALYVVNALSYFKKVEETGKKPNYVAGHSLGEFNALLAAECFGFEAGLKLVKKRGELMSQATEGGMAAIMNASKEEIESVLMKNNLNKIDLANFNTLSQTVISGDLEEIGQAQFCFQEGEVLYYPLNTSGAFHSRFMQDSKEKFLKYLKRFKLSAPKIPVVSNVTARPYLNDEIEKNLSNQIASAVRWCDSIQYLIQIGNENSDPMEFEEVGHGDVLTKLAAKIQEETQQLSKDTVSTSTKEEVGQSSTGSKTEGEIAAKETVEDVTQESPEIRTDFFEKMKSLSNAEEKVNFWNEAFAVGTKVKSTIHDYDALETRTQALVLFGHRAAVYMKDYNGYFDLDEITPV